MVWTDTVCGSNACFLTVHVRSWDGVAWRDWTKGTITMASANVSLTSGSEQGMPKEIRLTGGEYTGADAGPQRARTAVWTSTDGAPYALSGERLAPSGCLYHTLLDANQALVDEGYLEKAQWLYTEAVENKQLKACWKRRNELSELRSFASSDWPLPWAIWMSRSRPRNSATTGIPVQQPDLHGCGPTLAGCLSGEWRSSDGL